jgi:hypothetical protein
MKPNLPEGFDSNGRHLLAECPEFQLFELGKVGGDIIVERSPAVETAYWKCLFRIIDRDDQTAPEERMAMAYAVASLFQFTKSGNGFASPTYGETKPLLSAMEGRGGNALACRFAHTLGRRLVAMAESKDVKSSIDDCAAFFKSALSAFAVSQDLIPDGRAKSKVRAPIALISTAESIFSCHRRQPSKSEIRASCELYGMKFKGKDQRGAWEDAFTKAGLGNLPDSPPS